MANTLCLRSLPPAKSSVYVCFPVVFYALVMRLSTAWTTSDSSVRRIAVYYGTETDPGCMSHGVTALETSAAFFWVLHVAVRLKQICGLACSSAALAMKGLPSDIGRGMISNGYQGFSSLGGFSLAMRLTLTCALC